jgi:hypothetical protein
MTIPLGATLGEIGNIFLILKVILFLCIFIYERTQEENPKNQYCFVCVIKTGSQINKIRQMLKYNT